MDHSYLKNFKYSTRNSYHERLEDFAEFVFRDDEAEKLIGKWNQDVFQNNAPLYVEVGSGYGHFMMKFCEQNPNINFIGIDYRFKRTYSLAKKLKNHPSGNFRFLRAKGERIGYLFAENEIDHLLYFFPDPWPKTRHQKKRLFQKPFLEFAFKIIKPGGKIFIKTDHDGYATWMEDILRDQNLFSVDIHTKNLHEEHPNHFLSNIQTKFEKIFISKGINIKAFELTSNKVGN